jgi:hypothetical protein
MYFEMLCQMKKSLGQLDKWLGAATAHAKDRPYDPNLLLDFRLAPDQFPLVRQVRTACDTAKFMASRLSGKPAPVFPDTETTIDELHARIRAVIAFLDGFSADDFKGAGARVVALPHWEGKVLSGADYFQQNAVPNFFFHLTHAYAILRHGGVNLGKRDFIGELPLRDA